MENIQKWNFKQKREIQKRFKKWGMDYHCTNKLAGTLPWPGEIADEPESFAKQATALYSDESEWQLRQARGTDLLKQRFQRAEIGDRVLSQVESCLEQLESHRKKNFIGQMLQHQTMKATQYLSQWIEAKNQRS